MFSTRYIEAEMAKELLEGEGIEVLISSDDQGGIRPEMAFTGGGDFLVTEEDVPEAKGLLDKTFSET